jgi:hypothetical protein
MSGSWILGLYPTGLLLWPVGGQLVTLVLAGVLLVTVAGLVSMRERPDHQAATKTTSVLGDHDRCLPRAA